MFIDTATSLSKSGIWEHQCIYNFVSEKVGKYGINVRVMADISDFYLIRIILSKGGWYAYGTTYIEQSNSFMPEDMANSITGHAITEAVTEMLGHFKEKGLINEI